MPSSTKSRAAIVPARPRPPRQWTSTSEPLKDAAHNSFTTFAIGESLDNDRRIQNEASQAEETFQFIFWRDVGFALKGEHAPCTTDYALPPRAHRDVGRVRSSHHSRRPRKRSCDSMMDSSSCARRNPARPLLGLLLRSLSIRRSAAATRSRARSRSAMVYCRGSGRARFLRGPFAALLARMAALGCFPGAIVPLRLSRRIPPLKHIRRGFVTRVRANLRAAWS